MSVNKHFIGVHLAKVMFDFFFILRKKKINEVLIHTFFVLLDLDGTQNFFKWFNPKWCLTSSFSKIEFVFKSATDVWGRRLSRQNAVCSNPRHLPFTPQLISIGVFLASSWIFVDVDYKFLYLKQRGDNKKHSPTVRMCFQ